KHHTHSLHDALPIYTYTLKHLLGINGERLQNRAGGIDTRAVDPDALNDFKSIGNSQTLPDDTIDETQIKQLLLHLTKRVDERLKDRKSTRLNSSHVSIS